MYWNRISQLAHVSYPSRSDCNNEIYWHCEGCDQRSCLTCGQGQCTECRIVACKQCNIHLSPCDLCGENFCDNCFPFCNICQLKSTNCCVCAKNICEDSKIKTCSVCTESFCRGCRVVEVCTREVGGNFVCSECHHCGSLRNRCCSPRIN